MSINLNDSAYDGNEVKVFNDGEAGIVENVTISIEKRKPEDKENSPEYKIVYTDEHGGSCNTGLWYVEKETEYNSVTELIGKQGKLLKHMIHAIYGANYQIPTFENAKQMLDGAMKLIRDGLATKPKFRVFANYGTKTSVKNYIQIRSWVPFVEPMSVALEDTRLTPSNLDALARLQADTPKTQAKTASNDDDWD